MDSLEAAGAAPPLLFDLAALVELIAGQMASLLDVFPMELPQVVPKVVSAMEGLVPAGASDVVARVRLLFFCWKMAVLDVPLQVGFALESVRVAIGPETNKRAAT